MYDTKMSNPKILNKASPKHNDQLPVGVVLFVSFKVRINHDGVE